MKECNRFKNLIRQLFKTGDETIMSNLHISRMTFENIKHDDNLGIEYWYARELMVALEYKRWDKFCNVINDA